LEGWKVAEKDVILTIDESLWQKAKIQAVTEDITLREFVARAIQNELSKVNQRPVGFADR
jgi:predicted HicB family RNase H-like nuclease